MRTAAVLPIKSFARAKSRLGNGFDRGELAAAMARDVLSALAATPGLADVIVVTADPPQVVIVPDRHGSGTNALLLSPPDALSPAFGAGSMARHAARARAAGATVKVRDLPSLALDVDTREDVAALRAALAARPGLAPRTRAVLERPVPAGAR